MLRRCATTAHSVSFLTSATATAVASLRFCASSPSSAASAADPSSDDSADAADAKVEYSTETFLVGRALRRLGEDPFIVRRACQTQSAEQLTLLAKKVLALHKQRISTLRDIYHTSRFNVPRRAMLKMTLRRTRWQLYAERMKVRGIAAVFDIAVVLCLFAAVMFVLSGFRALSVWIRRMAQIEEFTQQLMMNTMQNLEEHGGGGEKYMKEKGIVPK